MTMKQLYFFSYLITCLSISAFSQEFDSDHNNSTAIKFAPASLWAGKVTLGGEYNFANRKSFTLVVGIPFEKSQKLTIDGKQSDLVSKAFSVMGGYRYYLNKNTMSGFYVEPYAKYVKHEAKGLIPFDLNGQAIIMDNYSEYSGFGVGAQIGLQAVIAKTVIFDLFLLGPEANSSKFSSRSTDITNNAGWDQADADDAELTIENILSDIPIVGDKIDVTVDTDKRSVFTRFSGFVPGFRIGASVGIRF